MTIDLYGQVEYPALQSIRKGKWDKAYRQLQDATRKDSTDIALSYGWATYFFSPDNPSYHVDSAGMFVRKAFSQLLDVPRDQRARPRRFATDSLLLVMLSEEIDSAAAVRASAQHTTASYQHFIDNFPGARQLDTLIIARNASAFRDASSVDSEAGYRLFMRRYPDAAEFPMATARYETLHFQSITRDQTLTSYHSYINDSPDGAYRTEAERNIFEISTASGTPQAFRSYLSNHKDQHPGGLRFVRYAQDLLYHLDSSSTATEGMYRSDSIRSLVKAGIHYIVPYLKGGKFGFMDQLARAVIDPHAQEISEDYLCGNIADDVLILNNTITALNGTVVAADTVRDFDDLGAGLLVVDRGDCLYLMHKSGRRVISDCFNNARLINNFIAIKKGAKWSLWTLAGRELKVGEWDIITSVGAVMVFINEGNYTLMTSTQVAALADGIPHLSAPSSVDEIATWPGSRIWARAGTVETILNYALDTLLTVDGKHLSQAPRLTALVKDADGTSIASGQQISAPFRRVAAGKRWTAVKEQNNAWYLYNPATLTRMSRAYDTLSLIDNFVMASARDSTYIHFPAGSAVLRLKGAAQAQTIGSRDSVSALLLTQGSKSFLYDQHGTRMFQVQFDRIEASEAKLFIVFRSGKAGLVDDHGKIIIPTELDAIVSQQGVTLSTLRGGRFGIINTASKKVIRPQYAKNVTCYNNELLVAFENGLCGLIDWNNKAVTPFSFDEIQYWNDSSALVKRAGIWALIDIQHGSSLIDHVRDIQLLRDQVINRRRDKLAIIQVDKSYGVIHNNLGVVIPFSFSDIVNVGAADEPLYFAEKHVEEAGVYVVNYFTATGVLVRKEVYDQDEYERIYCPNN